MSRENLLRILFLIIALILTSSLGLTYFEKDMSFSNALWWSVVTITTVGYGDIFPITLGGKLVGIMLMFLGIGILGVFTAIVASSLLTKKLREDRGMSSIDVKNHTIICEWNNRAEDIIHEFSVGTVSKNIPIVLISDDIDEKPLNYDNLYFVRGAVNDETLERANIKEANTVIILIDDKLTDITSKDGKVVLTTLAVESINRDVYTCVELLSLENLKHLERAGADEIIVREEYSSRLLTQASLNHGITKFFTEILSRSHGQNIYKINISNEIIGKNYLETLCEMKDKYGYLVVAVQAENGTLLITNPNSQYIMKENDKLIIISAGRTEV